MRLRQLEIAYQTRDEDNKELLRYFPIAVVACKEAYFRLAIKELIDSGNPYLANAQSLVSRSHIGFEVLSGLHGQSITIGDVIGHSVSISSLTHVSSHMNQLIGGDFLRNVTKVHDRYAVEVDNKKKSPIISDPDATFRHVARAFELRHIFCHETASNHEFDTKEIEQCFEHSVMFLEASIEYVTQTLFPNAPLTQMDMNAAALENYKKEKERLDSHLAQVSELLSDKQKARFREANGSWEAFVSASVDIEALAYEGGSIMPAIANSAAARLTRERAEQIKALIKNLIDP